MSSGLRRPAILALAALLLAPSARAMEPLENVFNRAGAGDDWIELTFQDGDSSKFYYCHAYQCRPEAGWGTRMRAKLGMWVPSWMPGTDGNPMETGTASHSYNKTPLWVLLPKNKQETGTLDFNAFESDYYVVVEVTRSIKRKENSGFWSYIWATQNNSEKSYSWRYFVHRNGVDEDQCCGEATFVAPLRDHSSGIVVYKAGTESEEQKNHPVSLGSAGGASTCDPDKTYHDWYVSSDQGVANYNALFHPMELEFDRAGMPGVHIRTDKRQNLAWNQKQASQNNLDPAKAVAQGARGAIAKFADDYLANPPNGAMTPFESAFLTCRMGIAGEASPGQSALDAFNEQIADPKGLACWRQFVAKELAYYKKWDQKTKPNPVEEWNGRGCDQNGCGGMRGRAQRRVDACAKAVGTGGTAGAENPDADSQIDATGATATGLTTTGATGPVQQNASPLDLTRAEENALSKDEDAAYQAEVIKANEADANDQANRPARKAVVKKYRDLVASRLAGASRITAATGQLNAMVAGNVAGMTDGSAQTQNPPPVVAGGGGATTTAPPAGNKKKAGGKHKKKNGKNVPNPNGDGEEEEDDPDKPKDRDNVIGGLKMGIWGALALGLLMGPAGLFLGGALAFTAGYALKKFGG